MLSWLQNHPFAVEAFFERSLVLTLAVPQAAARPMLPECLEPDTIQNRWAFLAVALVQTRDLRPKQAALRRYGFWMRRWRSASTRFYPPNALLPSCARWSRPTPNAAALKNSTTWC